MCTASYLPLAKGEYLITASRDEKTARLSARFPVKATLNGQTVYFPQDPQGHGSWIATAHEPGFMPTTVCLLNGAFQAHTARPPYRHSRGLVVLEVFRYASPGEWLAGFNFENLEPFTLLILQPGQLWEVRWDGKTAHSRQPDPAQPAIWSSSTLYTPPVVARREAWFQTWLRQQTQFTVAGIRQFHKQAGRDDPQNAVLMNRGNGMQTLSLTTVRHHPDHTEIFYEDLTTSRFLHHQLTPSHELRYTH